MAAEKEDTRDLFIRTPLEEFKAFARHKIEFLEKYQDVETLKQYRDAFELGVAKLNEAMAPEPVEEEAPPPPPPAPKSADSEEDGPRDRTGQKPSTIVWSLLKRDVEEKRPSLHDTQEAEAVSDDELEEEPPSAGKPAQEHADGYVEPQTEILHESLIAEYHGEADTGRRQKPGPENDEGEADGDEASPEIGGKEGEEPEGEDGEGARDGAAEEAEDEG